jgi:5'-nucleotidase
MSARSRFFIVLTVILCLFAGGAPLSGQTPLKILISNDDGIDAPGLAALYERLTKIGTVVVAAPSQNYSGASHSMTFSGNIFVTEREKDGTKWFGIKATPATCVRLALESLVAEKPDLVVTGINNGENLGTITFYSGTCGCACEAAVKGIPAIAVSLSPGPTMDYGPAADCIVDLIRALREKPMKPGLFLNVNVPNLPKDEIKGMMVVPQDMRPSNQSYARKVDSLGQVYYLNSFKALEAETEKTDVWAVRNGYISITPFLLDQTSATELDSLESLKIAGWKK